VSARRAGFGGRGVTLAVVAGFVVGAIVLLLQVVLQPGKAVQGGVADGAGPTTAAATAPPSPGARAVEAPIRG
jgi:hypothetical protein